MTREEVQKGSLVPFFIPTAEHPADLMTKHLDHADMQKHLKFMGFRFEAGRSAAAPQLQSDGG